MTKVSWKRILQRAGNDLPSHGRPAPARVQPLHRGPQRMERDQGSGVIAGELESELRRALQRAQKAAGPEPDQPAWDPIFMAQELRHTPPAVPVAMYPEMQQAKPRGTSNTT